METTFTVRGFCSPSSTKPPVKPMGQIPQRMTGDTATPPALLRIPEPPPPISMLSFSYADIQMVSGSVSAVPTEVDEEEPTSVHFSVDRRLKEMNLKAVVCGVVGVEEESAPHLFKKVMAEHSNPPRQRSSAHSQLEDSLDCQAGEVAPEDGATVDIEHKLKVQKAPCGWLKHLKVACAILTLAVIVLGGLVARKHTAVMNVPAASIPGTPARLSTLSANSLKTEVKPSPRKKRRLMSDLYGDIPPLRPERADSPKSTTFHVDMDF